MSTTLDDRSRELLQDKNFVTVSTLRQDGSIHSTLVWVDVDDQGNVLLNSSEGRRWPENLRRTGTATLLVADRENPYETVQIVGRLVEATRDGADEHIDALAQKYLGQETYPYRQPGEQRIKIMIAPERVSRQGG
jgi:PPOX class probable F420-dependent enzyme